MRKITAGLFISLDGVVENPHEWHFPYFNDETREKRVEIVQRVLGHRDIRSTLGYAELQDAQVRAALEGWTPR